MGDKYNSSLEDATKLKFAPFCSSSDTLSNESIFCQSQIFHFQRKNHELRIVHGLVFGSPEKGSEKRMSSERASQGEQNGTNFSL